MARLSGMPSEHHHEGPGDAPRRKRGRPNKNQASSSQAQSQSQDVASGKRTASPGGELSQKKRTKRVQADDHDDEDQIAQEMQDSFSRSQHGETIHVEQQTSTTTTRRNGRRHSEPPAAAQDDGDEEDELYMNPPASTQPVQGLTPHLNRVGAARRDLATTRRARMSMPAQLHIERVDEAVDGNHFQYAPLTAVLDGRTRRRLRRSHLSQEVNDIEEHQKLDKQELLELRRQLKEQDQKIQGLEFRLEAGRLGNIDMTEDHAAELQDELDRARDQIHELRASSLYNGSEREMSAFDGAADLSDVDEEPLMLVEPSQLGVSRDIEVDFTPSGRYASRVEELSSQMTLESLPQVSQLTHDTLLEGDDTVVPDTIHDQAVERYERELQHYIEVLAKSQGALRVVTLELQNLHFLGAGASSDEILVALRHGFDTLRTEVEKFFPGTTADLTNQAVLLKIPELFGGLFFELNQKVTQAKSLQKTEILLRRQYEGVLDLLGESEERLREIEQNAFQLDKSNEDKQRTIGELEERVTTLTTLTNGQDVEMTTKNAEITALEQESQDKDTALGRLREAIEKYRQDLDQVTVTATTFEKEHHEMIKQMETEHEDVINALKADLYAETDAREAAQGDAQQKGELIDSLESRIERMETEVTEITEEMTELSRRLAEQTKGRVDAESQRDEQAIMANDYANEIEDMKVVITNLKAQVAELQINVDREREQRQTTETALDKANEEIDSLDEQIRNAGIQANQLRQKLFQAQMDKDAAMKQLEEDAEEREDDLNNQLTAQTEARSTAEKTVAKLNNQVERLEADLQTTTIELDDMTDARQLLEKDREEQVTNLNVQLTDLKVKYTALENSTTSTITSLQSNITSLNNEVHRQQNEIDRLVEDLHAKETQHAQDTAVLTSEITDLREDLAAEQADNASKQAEITTLSTRVENEALELLTTTTAHASESASLRSAISTHESTIQTLQDHAATRAAEYEDLLAQRTREMEDMQLLGDARVETITLMQTQIDDLKRRFAEQEEDTRVTVDALNLAHRSLLDENERLADALKKRNADTLQAVREMKTAGVVVKSRQVDLGKVQGGKVAKMSEKVKVGKKGGKGKAGVKEVKKSSWRDSGMWGMSSPAKKVDGEEEGEMEVPEGFLEA